MNCNQAIEFIYSLEKFGIKPGLERIRALCEYLGNPQERLKVIHVAGTNGKGSVSTMLANILHAEGLNVGLYTSPYVIDFRERIQYNGKMIEHSELAEAVSAVKGVIESLNAQEIEPTEFEAITAAAFVYFARKGCDIVVLETGLGGRFDATNIINAPYASVIMSVSFDHTAILGNTLEKIAAEKCGIIKFGGTTVSYPEQSAEVESVIKRACGEKQNKLIIPDLSALSVMSEDVRGSRAIYKGVELEIPLPGAHMVKNAAVAFETAKALSERGINVSDDAILRGIAASTMPARLEITRRNPLTILDGGHNESCAEALAAYIKTNLQGRRIIALGAMMADKDYDSYLRLAAPLFDVFIATSLDMPRALAADKLKAAAEKYCENCYCIEPAKRALNSAKNITESGDVLLVCGSFYLAAELRDDLLN